MKVGPVSPGRPGPDLRWLRLRAVWVLIVPFYGFARPTPRLLLAGGGVAFAGLIVRAWAAASIDKERRLSTDGPYAFTRNPLYLGSLLVGLGVTIAGGRLLFVVLFAAFFAVAYGATMLHESRLLTALFGERYRAYAAAVPVFLPRLTPYRSPDAAPGARPSAVRRYLRNREWEAFIGVTAGFAALVAKWWWFL